MCALCAPSPTGGLRHDLSESSTTIRVSVPTHCRDRKTDYQGPQVRTATTTIAQRRAHRSQRFRWHPPWVDTPSAAARRERNIEAVAELARAHHEISNEIAKRIVGQPRVIEHLLTALFARGQLASRRPASSSGSFCDRTVSYEWPRVGPCWIWQHSHSRFGRVADLGQWTRRPAITAAGSRGASGSS